MSLSLRVVQLVRLSPADTLRTVAGAATDEWTWRKMAFRTALH